MSERLSSTSTLAITGSWRQQGLHLVSKGHGLVLRKLTPAEKILCHQDFLEGDIKYSWYAVFAGEHMLCISDNCELLRKALWQTKKLQLAIAQLG
jgi:hypothetical protein